VLRGILLGLCLVALLAAAAFVLIPRGGGADHASLSPKPIAARPERSAAVASAPAAPRFDIVSVAPDGTAVIAGRAAPGSLVQVFDGGEKLGEVVADQRGEWVLIPAQPLAGGGRRLTLRSTTGKGLTVASAETVAVTVPHAAPAAVPRAPAAHAYVVQRGNTLWQIARRFFGAGIHYLAIYSANLGHIRNPDLIYPGQTVKLPKS
jgi:nucleoid-associated protein YgaU